MNTDYIGISIILLVIGIALFPMGIIYFNSTMEGYKELTPIKKIFVVIVEIIDVFTTPTLSTWIIFISLIFIISGIGLLFVT